MINDEEIRLLKNGSLHLDCPSIELTSGDGFTKYAGPGYIRQDREKGFRATVFVPGTLEFGKIFESYNSSIKQAGTLIPRDEHWSLMAVDTRGRSWIGNHIFSPDQDGCVNRSDGSVVSGYKSNRNNWL